MSKMHKKAVLFIFVLILASSAFAQVPTFHQFYGEVRNSSGNLLSGTATLSATINNIDSGSCTAVNGTYGQDGCFVENGDDGDLIMFFISSSNIGNYTFKNEETTSLNFVYDVAVPFCGDGVCNAGETCSSCSDCGACRNNDGGGGPGGPGTPPNITNATNQTCIQNVQCSSWGACTNGIETRVCEDKAKCVSTKIESRNCESQEETPFKAGANFLAQNYYVVLATLVVLILIVAIIIILLLVKTKAPKNSMQKLQEKIKSGEGKKL